MFVEHKSHIQYASQSADSKEILSLNTDDNLHSLKITPCLKLIRIMLENIPFSTKSLLILHVSMFLQKINVFGQDSTFPPSNSVTAV